MTVNSHYSLVMSNSREEYEREFVRQAFNLASTGSQKKKTKKIRGNTRINLHEQSKPSPEELLMNNIRKITNPKNRLNEGVATKILNGLNGSTSKPE